MPKLRISEIFESIQGEGVWLGTPSVFVRVSGCNLRCGWCDTPYASWEPEGPVLEVNDVAEDVSGRGISHVVLTGGEPMLFDATVDLAQELASRGHVITVETAGTVYRELPCRLMSISPKLSGSNPGERATGDWALRHEQTRINHEVLRRLIAEYPYQLKFVLDPDKPQDIKEIEELLRAIGPVDRERILIMAEGTDAATLHKRERALVQECMKRGWRLTPRFHIDLFGDTRGT